MPIYNSYTNPSRYWEDIKKCLNGDTVVGRNRVHSSFADMINYIGDDAAYVSADVSSSPFHAIANFTQSVKGFSVTTSRTSTFSLKRYYEDENNEIQSYIKEEASFQYNFTATFVNTGSRGRIPFRFDVPSGQELVFPSNATQVDGWNIVYDIKSRIEVSSSDDVGSWSFTSRTQSGDETTNSGEIRPIGRTAYGGGFSINMVESDPETLYFVLAQTMPGVLLGLYKDGSPANVLSDHNWFAASNIQFAQFLRTYRITNDPNTDLSVSTVSSPVSGLAMEGLSIQGPNRLEDDPQPSDPENGDEVRTYTYNDSQFLTWLYFD